MRTRFSFTFTCLGLDSTASTWRIGDCDIPVQKRCASQYALGNFMGSNARRGGVGVAHKMCERGRHRGRRWIR